jgi:23S rRNA (uracil1939-C5)-methyltransferase
VHHPVINRVAAQVRDTLARHHVPTYSDAAHAGVARYLQVVIERETQRAQVTLITNGTSHDALAPFFVDLRTALGAELHSLWWNGNPERTNAILGPHWQHLYGPRYVTDRSGDAHIFYPPHAFGQSNLDLAMQLAARVRELARPATRITEYYAGVGAIGLGLASTAAALRLNELGEGSLEGLAHGVSALPAPQESLVTVYRGSAGAHAVLIADSDFVIADPPRKGLDVELLAALRQTPPRRFAYVSCDIDSLERDVAQLLASLRLVSLEAFDLFPHTEHIETLAVFEAR